MTDMVYSKTPFNSILSAGWLLIKEFEMSGTLERANVFTKGKTQLESLESVKPSMNILWRMRLKCMQKVHTKVEVFNLAWQISEARAKFAHCKRRTRVIAKSWM